ANVSNLRSGGPLFKQLTHCSTGSESHGRSAQGSNRERATRTMGRTPSLCGSAGAQVNQNSKSASEFRLSGFEFRLSATHSLVHTLKKAFWPRSQARNWRSRFQLTSAAASRRAVGSLTSR